MPLVDKDLISIIIVNYNTFDLTCNCIQSIYEKTSGVDFEIILVDNASQEKDPEQFREKHPNIILVKSKGNAGFAAGNNLGIEKSKGNFILLINSDAKLKNNAVYHTYDRMRTDDTLGVIGGQLIFPNGQIQYSASRFPTIKKEISMLFRLYKVLPSSFLENLLLGPYFNHKKEKEVDWVWGAFFMFRREDLSQFPNQKLHEDFFMYGEDVQWCYYFKKNLGKKILFFPGAIIIHHKEGSSSFQHRSEKLVKKILPNRSTLIAKLKGRLYKRVYFFILFLRYLFNFQPISERKIILKSIWKHM